MEAKVVKGKRRKGSGATDYVDNKEFYRLLCVYYAGGEGAAEAYEQLGQIILLIVHNYARKPNWRGYSWRDEMIGDAIVKMAKALDGKKFNIENNTSPFAYYTTIASHEFLRRYNIEMREKEKIGLVKDVVYNMAMLQCDKEFSNEYDS